MSQSFPKLLRLRKRHEFQRMSQGCKRIVARYIIIDSRENRTNQTRLGITATRHYGPAHERNRFKRIVREAFRLSYQKLPQGLDLNIKPRSLAKSASMADIASDLVLLMTDGSEKKGP